MNRLSRAHGRYRRQTDGRAIAYSERERSLKTGPYILLKLVQFALRTKKEISAIKMMHISVELGYI